VTDLLDGLAILTGIRLPRVANDPDAMRIGDACPGTDTVLVFSKSIRRDRRKYRLTMSTGLRCRRPRRALAMPAGGERRPPPLANCEATRQGMQAIRRSFHDEGRQGRPQLCARESTVFAMTWLVCQLAAALKSDAGNGTVVSKGNRQYSFVTAIALSELHTNSVPCEVDAAQLRQGHPAIAADVADFPENQAEWRVPRRMRRRPDPHGDVPAIGLEVQKQQGPASSCTHGPAFCASSVRCDAVSTRHPRAQPMKS
jgi:hypothetical protein